MAPGMGTYEGGVDPGVMFSAVVAPVVVATEHMTRARAARPCVCGGGGGGGGGGGVCVCVCVWGGEGVGGKHILGDSPCSLSVTGSGMCSLLPWAGTVCESRVLACGCGHSEANTAVLSTLACTNLVRHTPRAGAWIHTTVGAWGSYWLAIWRRGSRRCHGSVQGGRRGWV